MDHRIKEFDEFSLRKFVKGKDEEALYSALSQKNVIKHMASEGISLSDCKVIIEESLEHWRKYSVGAWAVEKNGVVIGWAGFKVWHEEGFELLIVLGSRHWGLGKRIYSNLVKIAKEEFKLKHLIIILPESRKSFSYLVNKIGFKHVGKEVFKGESFQKFTLNLGEKRLL